MAEHEQILQRLDKLIRLLSMHVMRDLSQREQIGLLAKAGFQPKDIADLLGTTPNTVSVTLSDLRKRDDRLRRGKS